MHQGWGPGTRLAQPVCWEPRVRRDGGALVRKAELSLRGFPSTHWASLGFMHDFVTDFITNDHARCEGGAVWLTAGVGWAVGACPAT